MAEEVKYNNTLVSGRADETLTYTRYIKDESSGKSTKELLDEKVNKTDQLGTTQIADNAVTNEKLAEHSVDNSKLSPDSVSYEKIQDGAVITEKIQDKAVTTEKVEEKAITNSKLGDQSVDGRVVREASLETKHFANESVTTEKVARKSITKDKLADNSVDDSQVVDGSIGNAKLSPDSVTTEKIKDSSVTNEKVANDTLGIEKFDPELRKTIQAATGLPDDLSQMIQDVDKSVKQLHEKDTDLQSQVDDKQQQITANDGDISLLQTRSTQMEEAIKGISASGGASQASAVTYENTESGLDSVTAQGAIDELANNKFNKENIAQEFGDSKDKVVSQFALPFRKKESLQFQYLIVDSNDRFLFGIRMDGTVDWAKGVPFPVLQKIKEIIKEKNDNNGELVQKLNNAISELNEQKVDKEIGKSLISEGIAEAFSIDDNEEFLYAIKDLAGNLLWGIKKDGSTYDPNGIPEKVKKLIEEINKRINKQETRLHLVDNSDYVFAIADEMNNLLFAIDKRGASFVNALKGVMVIEKGEDENFIFAVKDSADNLLFGIRYDGTFVCSKFELPVSVIKQLEEAVNSKYLHTEDEDMEYIFRLQDVKGAVLFGVKWDGTNYIPKGIPLEQIAENKKIEKQITSLEEKLANFRGGTGDWSNAGKVQIPIPRCAMFNLLTSTMPTAKSGMGINGVTCDIPCYAEFWDMQGNYFKIPILLSAQGNSSMGFIKKNLAIDLFSDETRRDSFIAKFGDWVSQDSFHLKAYYTDTFRGVGAVSYMLYEEMVKTRDICDDRPYKSEFTGEYTESEDGINSETSLDRNFDTGAKCFPQGFPVIVYQNGEFYGVYSWQLKKHRDNMHQDKKVAEHIHLDGTLDEGTIFGGNIKWEQFEVRNPKNLYMQNRQVIGGEETLTYNGDYPKEIMGDDAEEYNAGNKDMKRCATVKKYIIALSGRIAELKQAETDGKSTDEIKALVEKYFKVSFLVDYILETNLMYDYDGYAKNWQWTTYNGVQWTVNPYDHDCILGDNHNGNYVSAPEENWIANTLSIPSGWILKYYLPELKARWAQLRKMGIFDYKHIAGILNDWCVRIGYDNWKSEYKKWNESPCYRPSLINSTYWERSTSYVDNWSETTIYRKGFVVDRKGKAYKSLIEGNIGNDPLLDDGTKWEDVTYSAERKYSVNDICYYGKTILYGFKCKSGCTGEAPLTGFYNLYPMELGHYDSVYRVEKWLKKRIGYMDKLLNYSEV